MNSSNHSRCRSAAKMRSLAFVLAAVLCSAISASAQTGAELLKGSEFDQRLQEWTSVSLLEDGETVARLSQRLADVRSVAILLDRRLDPSRAVSLTPPVAGSLQEVVDRIAADQGAVVETVGSTVLVIPEDRARRLRTLIALREAEVRASATKSAGVESRGWLSFLERRRFQWPLLAQPRELAIEFARRSGHKVINPEAIPHDLWRAGTLSDASAIEVLSLILFQYELTFRWTEQGDLEIVPAPRNVAVTESYSLPSAQLDAIRDRFAEEFPAAEWAARGSRRIEATGPVELHDAIRAWRAGGPGNAANTRVGWKQRRFTLRVQQNPLDEVLKYLKQAGIPLEFDLEQLKAQGVDVSQRISFDIKEADADELAKALCGPQRIPYEVTDEGIQIGRQD
ncbi:hypothetical protein [Rubinisphaera margarita]|uniref:hypothetical protein n=1 Tax=Rubinisphaera margarita TaxID=2909586 RepID=UPI001EE99159|nr:hypothetical protein [Rubinisphaera margarita]MCG6155445.1 hypothetical protein [Rubinisphaera margarita]